MDQAEKERLQDKVTSYWNAAACGTEVAQHKKFSKNYFEDIESYRYKVEPEIFSFAQFSRFNNKKVLEVGVGAGTDFLQWVRSGAQAYGIDATLEAIEHTRQRLSVYGLSTPYYLEVADAQALPFDNESFDLVYSWGVIHHAPDTQKCLHEIIRVTKPGGSIKVMVYNRYSLFAVYRWLLAALFKGKPFQSLKTVLYHNQESPGTQAFTRKEVLAMLHDQPIDIISIQSKVTYHDLLCYKSKFFQFLAYSIACIFGYNRIGWFMTIELRKK